MQPVELNTIQGGKEMKCSICGTSFKPENDNQDICDNCTPTVEGLSNGKGDENE